MPHPQDILTAAFAMQRAGQVEDAEKTLRSGLRQWPSDAGVNFALASLLFHHGKHSEATVFAQRAAELGKSQTSNDPRPLTLLAKCLLRSNKLAQSDAASQKAISLAPNDADALNTYACSLLAQHRSDEAMPLMERAVAIEPDNVACLVTYAAVLTDHAQAERAHTLMRHAATLAPSNLSVLVGCASGSLYCDSVTPQQKRALAQRAGAAMTQLAQKVGTVKHEVSDFSTTRPLRVALLSNDFRQHSCAYFLGPLMRNISPQRHGISLHALSLTDNPDTLTSDFRTALSERGGSFEDVHKLQPTQLAAHIVRSKVDVVLDLGGYSSGSGIETLALKPAPLIGAYLGYAATTGLDAIDFRIVDAVTDPLHTTGGDPHSWHSERLVRLDRCFVCYDASMAPAHGRTPRPAGSHSPITFGSFNAPAKISKTCIDLWSSVLKQVPHSRLLLKGVTLGGLESPRFLRAQYAARGIADDRIECIGRTASVADHLALYERVDIALDTFPYNGTTTTCEALAMGVPVVTLAGIDHVSRVSASLLTHCNAHELVTNTREEFVAIAARLASDGPSLQHAHETQRARFLTSQVCDQAAFAVSFAKAIREEWAAFAGRSARG